MSTISEQCHRKGKEYIDQAEKKLKSWSIVGMFGGGSGKYEAAFDLYDKAAAQFKQAQEWDAAGDAYMQAAENAEKAQDGIGSASSYMNAAKAYKNGSTKEAIKAYNIAVQIKMDENQFNQAAKIYKEIAIIHEKNLDMQDAMKNYKKAADCWKGEEQMAHANSVLIKVAEIAASEHQFKEAVKIFEEVVTQSLENSLARHSVKDYLFKASLCQLVIDSEKGNMENFMDKLEQYKDMAPQFQNTRECTLLENLAKAFEEDNLILFQEKSFKYNQVTPFSDWATDLLVLIKNKLSAEGKTEGAGLEGLEDDLGDLDVA